MAFHLQVAAIEQYAAGVMGEAILIGVDHVRRFHQGEDGRRGIGGFAGRGCRRGRNGSRGAESSAFFSSRDCVIDMAIGDDGALIAIDLHMIRLNAVDALPEHHVAIVLDVLGVIAPKSSSGPRPAKVRRRRAWRSRFSFWIDPAGGWCSHGHPR